MDTPPDRRCRSLVAVPAYNEGATVRAVIDAVRANLPDCDVLVVDDGSRDEAATALAGTGAVVATHLCNRACHSTAALRRATGTTA